MGIFELIGIFFGLIAIGGTYNIEITNGDNKTARPPSICFERTHIHNEYRGK